MTAHPRPARACQDVFPHPVCHPVACRTCPGRVLRILRRSSNRNRRQTVGIVAG
jgi:hypothetical protein